MNIYHPPKNGVLPVPLEFTSYDPGWCWVYGNTVLIAAGAHDTVILLRLIRFGEMDSPLWIHRLLRHVIQECRERGFRRFMTWLADDVYEEEQLMKIATRYGATFEPFRGDLVLGEL